MRQISQQASSAQQIPPDIASIAASYTLGAPDTNYQSKNERTIAFFGLILTLFIVILSSFFFLILLSEKPWWSWFMWLSIMLIMFLLILVCIGMLTSPSIAVFLYSEGLIYHKKAGIEVIRWDQVEAFWEDISISHDGESSDTYKYRLQLSDGMQFEFPNEIVNVQSLGERIKHKVNQLLLPRTIRAYNIGSSLAFGAITVDQQGISVDNGRKILHWSEFEGISLGEEIMNIYRKGEQHAWYHECISRVANAEVFKGLADHISQELARQELSRAIVAYKAGSSIVFGRISISLQGIDIDKGKKVLPWRSIRKIDVDMKERKVSISVRSKLLNVQTLPVWTTSDPLLLKELVEHIMQEHMHYTEARVFNQLPQLIARYNAGTPLTFGRLSISSQGIALDGGRKFLAMNEISYLHIGTYIGGDQLVIRQKGVILNWQVLPVSELGDVDLLQGLIDHIIEEQQFI